MPEERVASRIYLTLDPADETTRRGVETDAFKHYLKRVHGGPITDGETFSEFINCGCGDISDVVLTVAAIEGGTIFGDRTEIVYR